MDRLKDTNGLGQIKRDLEHYCLEIGQRMAGSAGEHEAAAYTAQRFRELGLENVATLPFPCKRWLRGKSELTVLDLPERSLPCETYAHSVATPEAGVEGELVILEPVDYEQGLRRTDLEGKIGLFYGGYPASAETFAQLHSSPLRAMIFVDTRFTNDWPIADGMGEKFMPLVRKPMSNISLPAAWTLARDGARRVRLVATGEVQETTSQNVVGEMPGTDPAGKRIVVCGHIDAVGVGVGADDNASGMAAVFECARRLKDLGGRHTFRFIGFGAEEQLSVGSYHYVKRQLGDAESVGLVCNFDGIAALLGISEVVCIGTTDMADYLRSIVEERQGFGRVKAEVSPYQDQFPFAARGIPGVWFTRKTHKQTYWYHHSVKNDLDVCSVRQIAWTAETACEVLADLAGRDEWPFPPRIAPETMKEVQRLVGSMFPAPLA